MTEFLIPAGFGETELIEKKSRFIGRVWHIDSEEAALDTLASTRKQHADANHNVYCYILQSDNITRYSDAGEPQGTAALPALNVFQKEGITNVLCTITRYFGGTLLGSGGLVRAYAAAAKRALDAAGISAVRPWQSISLTCSYPQYERLLKLMPAHGVVVEHTDFGAEVQFSLLIEATATDAFLAEIAEVSLGNASAKLLDLREVAVKIR